MSRVMSRLFHICATAAAFTLFASHARAVTVELFASADNTLYESVMPYDYNSASANSSNGAGNFIFAGQNNGGLNRRGLITFDLASAIPVGAVVTDVSLRLYLSQTVTSPTFTVADVSLHRVLNAWGEGESDAVLEEGIGANAQAGDATWLHTFFNSSTWTNPGGDFVLTPSATASVGDKFLFYTWTGQGLLSDVQTWLNTPGENFGWILIGDESTNKTAKRFDSRERFETDTATGLPTSPLLTIEYTVIPEPSTVTLLLAGCVVLFVLGARQLKHG